MRTFINLTHKSRLVFVVLVLSLSGNTLLSAGPVKKTKAVKATQVPKAKTNALKPPEARPGTRPVAQPQVAGLGAANLRALNEAIGLVKSGQCEKAAPYLFTMSKKSDFEQERIQIKYLLGVCLMELKLHQVAAFQFVDVIRNGAGKYNKQAIEKLSFAADALGDDTMLNYAISKVNLDEFPAQNRDMIYYRLGEIKLKNARFGEAQDLFGKVGSGSRYYQQAQFNRGLSFLEGNQTREALRIFRDLLAGRSGAAVTDVNRVAAQMAVARTFYQAQDWENAIEAYRLIPRDTDYWHDAMFESSWAMLRTAKFRSALSNFQSLHSTYYEEFYLPESLLLRAIVYLYICKYDEMDKVLTLFEKTYGPVRNSLGQFLQANSDPMNYFNEMDKAYSLRKDKKINGTMKIPYSVARNILDQGDVKRSLNYIKTLAAEKQKIDSMPRFARTSLGGYATKVLANRARNTKLAIGDMVKVHMLGVRNELKDLYEQAGFIRYEMINGRKETLKKRIAGKTFEQVDDQVDRTFYVQNGYEYWPFEGEYWLDEIGNYHYLGKQSCE